MVTMVIGGAFISQIQGVLADNVGYRLSFIVCVVCYAYIFFFAIKGYKAGKVKELL
jgi:FHS family L-fucose permease-like MFS transporter